MGRTGIDCACNIATCLMVSVVLLSVIQAADKTVYVSLSESAQLPCASPSKPLVEAITRISWFVMEDGSNLENRITNHIFSNDRVYHGSNYSEDKYLYNKDDYSLTIVDVTYSDQMKYTCYQSGTKVQEFVNDVGVLMRPDTPNLAGFPTFQEKIPSTVECKVSSVKPGKGSIQFILEIGPEFSVESSSSDLSEEEVDSNTGAVSVTYSRQITLEKKHNGQNAACIVNWRGETFQSISQQTDVKFEASDLRINGVPTEIVDKNALVTVVCTTDEGNPTPSIIWYRNGQTLSVDTNLETVTDTETDGSEFNGEVRISTLKINADRTLNRVQYICRVEGTSLQESFNLDVAYVQPPLSLSGAPSSSTPVEAGETVQFTCSLDANPAPSYSLWSSDGSRKQKLSDVESGHNTVTLKLEKQHNRMGIFCKAEGSRQDYSLESSHKMYTVNFLPTMIELTPSHTGLIAENVDVTLTCETDESNPTAEILWSRDSETVSSGITVSEVSGQYNVKKRRSVLTVTTHRSLNGLEYKCEVQDQDTLSDSEVLQVKFPHNVQISQNPSETVSQGSSLTLTCEATGGNPAAVSYSWSFEPRYELSNQMSSNTDKKLVFDSVQYTEAGVYRCEVDNGAGVGNDSEEILVEFAPIDVSSATQKVTFTKVDAKAGLNCTVRAYPEVTKEHVTVMHGDSTFPANRIRVESVDKVDETIIELTFDSVTTYDFGLYEVVLNNGAGYDVTVNLTISEQSEPQPPHSFKNESVSSISITLSWVSGRNGGATQTFTVYHQKEGGGNDWKFSREIEDPGTGLRGNYTVKDLEPETVYLFRVIATNLYGSSAEKQPFEIKTQDLPTATGDLIASVSGNDITFTWDSLEGTFTKVEIHKCTSSCNPIFETSDPSTTSAIVSGEYSSDAQFRLAFYQGNELVNEEYFAVKVDSPPPGPPVAIIVAVCVVAAILIVVSVVVILFIRRKKMKGPHESAPLEISDVRIEEVDQAYTQVNKKGKKSKAPKMESDANVVYAEVNKPTKKQKNIPIGTEGTEYAGVDLSKKKKKQQRKSNAGEDNATYAEVEKSTKNKKKGKKQAKGEADIMMYANVTNTMDPDACEYQNVATKEEPQQPVDTGRYVTDEGLTYAAVAFDNTPAKTPKEPVIIGFDERVIYDAVDFKKMAEKVEGDQ